MAEVLATQGWTEVYAASGISSAISIYIQNKSGLEVYVFAGAEPAAGSLVGWMLMMGDVVQIETGEAEVWVRTERQPTAPLYVQAV
jgi:hypothetical protein